MKQINCNIIKDLLPLYADDVVCKDTAELVDGHLERCADCREELKRIKKPIALPIDNSAQPLKSFKKKWNRKKAVIAVLAAVITAAVLIGGFILHSYLTPIIKFAVSAPTGPNSESYAQMVTVGYSTKLGLPLPPRVRKNLAEFGEANSAALMELRENYTKPMQIEASVEVAGNQTIVTYSGTATDKTGNSIPYEKILVFDFVLTIETP